jgi:superfamily I DNA and/or RNA helicase
VYSVHEYQGREAGIVVVSLVRDRVRGDKPHNNLGHLTSHELVNVLMSRAQRLLVLVGRFKHFWESSVGFWKTVCDTVQREGRIVPYADLFPSEDGDG